MRPGWRAERSLALDPELAEGHLVRGTIIWNSFNRFPHEQTILSLKRAITLNPDLPEAHGQGFQHYHHTTYNIASAYALMGKRDEALRWLQSTAEEGFPCYPLFQKDANLDSLREDERFLAMMATMRQQWERFNANL